MRTLLSSTTGLLRRAVQVNRPLAVVAVAMLPLLAATLVGVALDPREITGAPAWIKPAKFAASISVYAFTLLWLLGRVRGRRRLVWTAGTLSAAALAVEWVVIAVQALRGTSSHFNYATPLDGVLAGVMGVFVVVIWTMNLLAAVLLARQPGADAAFAWSLRLGLVSALAGGAMGGAMVRPTAEQLAALEAGAPLERIGAHSVGVPDGGAGLPGTGWSTEGGDVRVPHFFGLHGLQAVPLLGWLVGRMRRGRAGHRLALVAVGGTGYLAFTGILFWQAMRGEPVVAPGAATLIALSLLVAVVAGSVAGVLLHARRSPAARGGRVALARAG